MYISYIYIIQSNVRVFFIEQWPTYVYILLYVYLIKRKVKNVHIMWTCWMNYKSKSESVSWLEFVILYGWTVKQETDRARLCQKTSRARKRKCKVFQRLKDRCKSYYALTQTQNLLALYFYNILIRKSNAISVCVLKKYYVLLRFWVPRSNVLF